MKLKRFDDELTVCRVEDITRIDFSDEFCFFARTAEELSLVCRTVSVPANTVKREDGWRAFRIEGELDFSLIGILSRISTVLADNGIGIFAVSTYNTDYILTKAENYDRALGCLASAGYVIE